MSIKVMTEVWAIANVSGSELLVLLAMADFADDQGRNIYPSMQTLSQKARLSESQTRRIVQGLIQVGLVEIEEPGGWDGRRNRANQYRIVLNGGGSNLTPPPLAQMRPPGADTSTGGSNLTPPPSRPRDHGGRAHATTGGSIHATTVVASTRPQSSLDPSVDPLDSSFIHSDPNERMNEDLARGEAEAGTAEDGQIEIDDCSDLLTDPAVGMDEAIARGLAAQYDFDFLERQVFAWLAHRDRTGNYTTVGALIKRITKGFSAPPLTKEQRQSDLYHRFHDRFDLLEPGRRRHRNYFTEDKADSGDPHL